MALSKTFLLWGVLCKNVFHTKFGCILNGCHILVNIVLLKLKTPKQCYFVNLIAWMFVNTRTWFTVSLIKMVFHRLSYLFNFHLLLIYLFQNFYIIFLYFFVGHIKHTKLHYKTQKWV